MLRSFILLAGLALTACSVPTETPLPTRAVVAETTLPPIKRFSNVTTPAPTRSNADMARDFLDLSFQLESGRQLPRLTRFEGPITVRIEGRATQTMQQDLTALLARLRREAKIDISQVQSGDANITIHAVTRRNIRRALPNAACFVVPNVADLSDYRSARSSARTDWSALARRDRIAIFLSYDTSPQDIRDCLHEELAQALGPLNDLFRLHDSVFNDDNFHSVLTGFDMLMLRAYYDPALQNGMSRTEAAGRIRQILARLNPAGERRASAPLATTPNAWKGLITTALGAPGSNQRLNAANRAVAFAQAQGWRDHRLAFSHYALARQLRADDLDRAKLHFEQAERLYAGVARNGPQETHMQIQLAAFDVAEGNADVALKRLAVAKTSATRAQNAAQLASVLMLQSEALAMTGRTADARRARLDSLGWARYGFGPDWAVQARLREIAALNPQNERL
ncbi:DUF2927 domain-containing protein [Cognatishimia sp.]|uniref:DUF2927 domain-containing protein n=1 Tax=Cognatishimia sp. TaxID=2211648 RepID=UPI00351617BC